MHFIPDARRIEVLDSIMVEVLRSKTPAERVAMGLECNRTARLLIEGHLRTQHPEWSDEQVAAEIARRMLGGTS
jgi:hypothetical protein